MSYSFNGRGSGNTKPAHVIKTERGGIQLSIWEKRGRNGVFYNVAIEKRYKAEDGTWKTANSQAEWELEPLIDAIREAQDWIQMAHKTGGNTGEQVYKREERPRSAPPVKVERGAVTEALQRMDVPFDDDDIPF